MAVFGSRAMTSNSRSTSLGLKRGRRLVEDDEVGVERERLGDLDELALRGGKAGAPPRRAAATCSWPRSARISLARAGASTERDRRPGRPRSGRKMFSSTERSGARLVSCMTMAMPASQRLARAEDVQRRAAIEDLAGVAADVTGNDARQRRLAGAVGAQQRMDHARPQR